MNQGDLSDAKLAHAFRDRLDREFDSPTLFTRTMAAIDAAPIVPARPRSRWRAATGWWSALAAPARFATAAAIVIVGGTVAFGTVKVTHDRVPLSDAVAGSRVTLDRRPVRAAQLARGASLRLVVPNVPAAVRDIAAIAARAGSNLDSRDVARSTATAGRAVRLVLRVPATAFDATLDALSTLGRVDSRGTTTSDLSGPLAAIDERLRLAQTPPETTRLRTQRAALERRIATATVVIDVRAANLRELSSTALRPTPISLARGSAFVACRSQLAWDRLHFVGRSASGTLAGAARTGGATAG